MFDPMIEKAFALVREQLATLKESGKKPFRILALCGGMGTNEYVWARFREYCETELDRVELVTDAKAWSAVVRGAAIRGLEGNIVLAKKARRWYGIQGHRKFLEGFDREEDAFECPINGKRASKHISWCVKK